MPRSATDLMQEIIFSAVIDATIALRGAARGLPNALWRDVGAVHLNTTIKDLPAEVQTAIGDSVRAAFAKLRQEGFTVAGGAPEPDRRAPVRPRPPTRTPPTVEMRRRPPPARTPPAKTPPKR